MSGGSKAFFNSSGEKVTLLAPIGSLLTAVDSAESAGLTSVDFEGPAAPLEDAPSPKIAIEM